MKTLSEINAFIKNLTNSSAISHTEKANLLKATQNIDEYLNERDMLAWLYDKNMVAMQAACIDAQENSAAEGMKWIFNTLSGPGLIPDEDEPYHNDAQKYFNHHGPDACHCIVCGEPSRVIGKEVICSAACEREQLKDNVPAEQHALYDLITPFCDNRLHSIRNFKLPFSHGDYTYATNSNIIIRTQRIDGVPERNKEHQPPVETIVKLLPDEHSSFAVTTALHIPEKCPDCKDGSVTFTSGNWIYETPCASCNGTTSGISDSIYYTPEGFSRPFRTSSLALIKDLPDLEFCADPTDGHLLFWFRDGSGKIMGADTPVKNHDNTPGTTQEFYALVTLKDGYEVAARHRYNQAKQQHTWHTIRDHTPIDHYDIREWTVKNYYYRY
ncbi:hypothetical protein [Oceanospirillum beijerinckii]|uniref:hypothetical protein n=1 Tax=Oceanospirillum beijerinckii TaxID=64976 RepID=UPI0004000EE3|nr:hypothetical protein [Oceanospirillum beijerinckii]